MESSHTTVTVEQVHDACRTILDYAGLPTLNYAVPYAAAMLENDMRDPYTVYVQCLYILNNLTRWRHTHAVRTRNTLKQYVKENAPR